MMLAYIWQSDLVCEQCRNAITESDPTGADGYPVGPYTDGGGESDCPQNCAGCHVFLENPLTDSGIEYVLEHLESECADLGNANRIMPKAGTAEACPSFSYWHGSPHKAIVLQWAESLSWYFLTPEQESRLNAAVEILNA